mmetsp:Transcript_11556/g.15741  ORF Transcript_11556/g.15741 Transcript_11556/m.15741 type:complete len:367 (+) Transcript_11556:250-1350(+)
MWCTHIGNSKPSKKGPHEKAHEVASRLPQKYNAGGEGSSFHKNLLNADNQQQSRKSSVSHHIARCESDRKRSLCEALSVELSMTKLDIDTSGQEKKLQFSKSTKVADMISPPIVKPRKSIDLIPRVKMAEGSVGSISTSGEGGYRRRTLLNTGPLSKDNEGSKSTSGSPSTSVQQLPRKDIILTLVKDITPHTGAKVRSRSVPPNMDMRPNGVVLNEISRTSSLINHVEPVKRPKFQSSRPPVNTKLPPMGGTSESDRDITCTSADRSPKSIKSRVVSFTKDSVLGYKSAAPSFRTATGLASVNSGGRTWMMDRPGEIPIRARAKYGVTDYSLLGQEPLIPNMQTLNLSPAPIFSSSDQCVERNKD